MTSLISRLAVMAIAVLALVGCGGDRSPETELRPGEFRLTQGLQSCCHPETSVGVQSVFLGEQPIVAALSLVDHTQPDPQAQTVRLAVGERARVGNHQFVLVGAGEGRRRPYVVYRLEPAEPEDGS